nr:magnetosome protein Mad10 [Desulfobacteraceae bacterium]
MTMDKSIRYKIQHVGDFFVEKVINKIEKGFNSIKKSTRGIVVTYDIHELRKSKKKVISNIGQRVTEIKRTTPELDMFQDMDLTKLFIRLDEIESRIELRLHEREIRLYPGKYAQTAAAI